MKRFYFSIFCIFIFTFLLDGQEIFDPWGVWNSYPVNIRTANIRTLESGQYYESGNSGLWIVKHCREHVLGDYNGPAFTVVGDFVEIERYETISNGYLFYLVGTGIKRSLTGGPPEWQDNTHIQVQMIFIAEDECFFKYVSFTDEKGFRLSFSIEENKTYKRLRVQNK
jgi:hypothetical protein